MDPKLRMIVQKQRTMHILTSALNSKSQIHFLVMFHSQSVEDKTTFLR